MTSGEYFVPYVWQDRTLATPDGFGERVEVLTAQAGYLWGTTTENPTSQVEEQFASDVNLVRGTVRLRNMPAVGPRDRLVRPDGSKVMIVSSRYIDPDNETVCEVVDDRRPL